MKFALDAHTSAHVIRSYAPGLIRIGDASHDRSLLVMPDRLETDWEPAAVEDLTARHFHQIIEFRPELVVLGTGERQVFPPKRIFVALMDAGIGYEVMHTAAACRTYNILISEGRRALGALFP